MRDAAHGYRLPEDADENLRSLFEALQALEAAYARSHTRIESSILFARALPTEREKEWLVSRFRLALCGVLAGRHSRLLRSVDRIPRISTILPIDHPTIQYAQAPLDDPIARLDKQLASGKIKLDFRSGRLGYLPSVLQNLGVNSDSQLLVFSKTSFQAGQDFASRAACAVLQRRRDGGLSPRWRCPGIRGARSETGRRFLHARCASVKTAPL